MTTIPQVSSAMKQVLEKAAEQAGRVSGYVQRASKLSPSLFCQTLVFGWMSQPAATLNELAQTAAALGVTISPQGLDARFEEPAARLLEAVLGAAMTQLIHGEAVGIPLLTRFQGVYLCDSTVIPLPVDLAALWPGLGTNQGTPTAALKVQVRWDYQTGALEQLRLGSGRQQDRDTPVHWGPLPPGALRLADLGFFALDALAAYDQAGVYFLSRLRQNTVLLEPSGQPLHLASWLARQGEDVLDRPILAGQKARLPCRLLLWRVPAQVAAQRRRRIREQARVRQKRVNHDALRLADWTLLITNLPPTLLTPEEAQALLALRWQIELLFKLWKSHAQLDTWRSAKPWRALCEVYAKLLVVILQHWIVLTASWRFPDRSLTKAFQTVQHQAMALATAFAHPQRLDTTLQTLRQLLQSNNRMNKRKKKPNTCQQLLAFADICS